MRPRVLVFGAGGHARTVVALIRRASQWDIAGVLDDAAPVGHETIDGISIHGPYKEAARWLASGVRHAALAVGDNDRRAELFEHFSRLGFSFPAFVHPDAHVEDNALLADGCIVCAGAILGAQVRIGCGTLVNTGAIVDHETVLGDFVHVAPGCRIAGRVKVGDRAFVGIGTSVIEKITIGKRTLVGAGSVVVDDLPDGVVAFGSPARTKRIRDS